MTVERYEFRLTRLEEEVRELRRNQVDTSKGVDALASHIKKHQDLLLSNHKAIADLEQVVLTLTGDLKTLSVKVDQNHISMESYIDRRMESFEASVNQRFDRVESDVSELKSDVSELKSDVVELKADVVELKEDVVELKSDVSGLKSDMFEVKSDIAEIKTLLKAKLV
ncbi:MULTISPECIES: hypothetical protein [Gammaproteobacteria]|uniref:hypothetical protein n=1 Tax=Gammaproteobacteria TaxID=1236 RepID=UPI001ADD41D4|nr:MULTISPECIES: hypothetical protein [Gammaproteobacteria]MBO9482118.1 hypothetical protein [Salinisphaera sp. G21_0]MBO9494652.1 hypothetical protein [Thalassotalea sp. G20_0]